MVLTAVNLKPSNNIRSVLLLFNFRVAVRLAKDGVDVTTASTKYQLTKLNAAIEANDAQHIVHVESLKLLLQTLNAETSNPPHQRTLCDVAYCCSTRRFRDLPMFQQFRLFAQLRCNEPPVYPPVLIKLPADGGQGMRASAALIIADAQKRSAGIKASEAHRRFSPGYGCVAGTAGDKCHRFW